MVDFYDDIYEFLESTDIKKSVDVKDFDDLIHKIRAKTELSYDASYLVLKYFFQEIRSCMLRGDTVTLGEFGKFFISRPKTGNKQKVFPKFKPD